MRMDTRRDQGQAKCGRRQREPPATPATRELMVGCVSENLGKQHAPQTPTTEHAAADQEAHKTAVLLIATFMFAFAFVAFMLLLLVAPFAQEMREEKPA